MRCQLLLAPLLLVTVFVTVPVCVSISISERHFADGLFIPMIMQTTRESPTYWVFGVGMTCVSVLLFAFGHYTERWMLAIRSDMGLEPGCFVPVCCRCGTSYERAAQILRVFFYLSGVFFALTAWSNHMFFHRHLSTGLHTFATVLAYACAVTAMNASHMSTNQLVKLLVKDGAFPKMPCALRAALLRSKRWKTAAIVVINISMAMHMPTAYIYAWFCSSGGGIPPEGAAFYTRAACVHELGRSEAYCESWRDARNDTMTLLYTPPTDVCPSLVLSAYNGVTQYVSIATLTLLVLTLHSDLMYEPNRGRAAAAVRASGAQHAALEISERPVQLADASSAASTATAAAEVAIIEVV